MATFLFNEIIFGPVQSRRLGSSLGVNLLPVNRKVCNFNCLYCECGFTSDFKMPSNEIPLQEDIRTNLENRLRGFVSSNKKIDAITFAGNGEPTLHPSFPDIIADTIFLRNKYFPDAKIAVLSNATLIGKGGIKSALQKIDYNILKLDSAIEQTIQKINCPVGNFSLDRLIDDLKQFNGNLTIQTLFLKGEYNGFYFDNTSEHELLKWLEALKIIKPQLVMIYSIARDTPVNGLQKIDGFILRQIAEQVENAGICVSISD